MRATDGGDLQQLTSNGAYNAESTVSPDGSRIVFTSTVDGDIELYSMCEHHMLPFFGKAHVAYIPNGKIVGLSKIPRVVDVFARRLQVQERLTHQIHEVIARVLQPKGVAVVIEAAHQCMTTRGVHKSDVTMVTSQMVGAFRKDARTRVEFLRMIDAKR